MKITIRPEHLKGNTYFNRFGNHTCPLGLALVPLFKGYRRWNVGYYDVSSWDEKGKHILHYKIPATWNIGLVERLIDEANEGSEATYEVELEDVNPIY
jgi:hypothetical protein